jgi:mannose-1-phosphate guanylyltransferase/mannose-6-phosphate isomerase
VAIHPVILCGGSGTRLWPLSRAMFPKQFIRLNGGNQSFMQATIKRLDGIEGIAAPTLLCNNDHRFLVLDEIATTGIEPHRIILEPIARNTAPAIAVAARSIVAEDPEAILVVMPSDHVIRNEKRFASAVADAAKIAKRGALVLFGIVADKPETGYGYIRRGSKLGGEGDNIAYEVAAFVEKPDVETAKKYLAEGTYYWNSGIFVLHAQTFLAELERFEPQIAKSSRAALARAEEDLGLLRLDRVAFAEAPAISVDYAVMERTAAAVMIPLDVGWSDVGSWASLWEIGQRDAKGNVVKGQAILRDSHDCYIHSERAVVTALGVKNLVVVETPDAILVADKDRTQEVGKLVKKLGERNRVEHIQHLRNHRPWGYFETLNVGPRFQVKRLHVKPGGKLSMQMHHHRSEHWVVVHGTAKVTIGDIDKLVRENESVYIFATQWHRLENPGKVPLELIEIQIGSYLGEDDIIRSDDVYHRAPEETR